MNWIKVEEKKPENNCLCVVYNEKGYMHNTLAIYHKYCDLFVEYAPHKYESLPLEVTHYVIIPEGPPKQSYS